VSDAAAPRVEFLWWRECPSWERVLGRLRADMEALGLDPEAIEMEEIVDQHDAERFSFVGSPTIRIDGADVQPPAEEPVGLTCRIYRHRDGRVSPLPDRDDVRDALREATERKEALS
jgi:hypothetical protein